MNSGSGLVETWIPVGGFEIQRRKVKTPEGGAVVTDCLTPKWTGDDLTADRPLHRQPCLHRVLATCRHDQIIAMANNYGLLTVTVARKPEAGRPVHADMLPPEPVEIWHKEIRLLRPVVELWDAITAAADAKHTGQDMVLLRRLLRQPDGVKRADLLQNGRTVLAQRISAKLASLRLELTASPDGAGNHLVLQYRPLRLLDAVWQRFAEEIAGLITCVRCPAPGCGRWFPQSAGRRDRAYCSGACRTRVWRGRPGADVR